MRSCRRAQIVLRSVVLYHWRKLFLSEYDFGMNNSCACAVSSHWILCPHARCRLPKSVRRKAVTVKLLTPPHSNSLHLVLCRNAQLVSFRNAPETSQAVPSRKKKELKRTERVRCIGGARFLVKLYGKVKKSNYCQITTYISTPSLKGRWDTTNG